MSYRLPIPIEGFSDERACPGAGVLRKVVLMLRCMAYLVKRLQRIQFPFILGSRGVQLTTRFREHGDELPKISRGTLPAGPDDPGVKMGMEGRTILRLEGLTPELVGGKSASVDIEHGL